MIDCKEPSTKIRIVTILEKLKGLLTQVNCKEPSTKIRIVTIIVRIILLSILYCKEPSTKIRIVTLPSISISKVFSKIAKNLLLK